MAKDILCLFRKVKLLALDVDGVLTRGEIIYDDRGAELKIFNVRDGLGVVLLGKVGVKTAIVTAKDGRMVRRRARDMGIGEVVAGLLPKEKALPRLLARYHLRPEDICFIGDDLIDMGLMQKVGLGVTVADAPDAVKKVAGYVTKKRGGEGAVREVVELIIKAQRLEKKIAAWVKNPVW